MTASEELLQVEADSFEAWRNAARRLLACGAAPATIQWIDRRSQAGKLQRTLSFTDQNVSDSSVAANGQVGHEKQSRAGQGSVLPSSPVHRVPQAFLDLAKSVAQHRSTERWSLLYRMLWRITGGERHLLEIASDSDVYRARQMEKAIRRDAHKMKAFVRFRKTGNGDSERFVAWHQPDHYVVPIVAPFFARRFDVMKWAILTPDESVWWDGEQLEFGPGCSRAVAGNRSGVSESAGADSPLPSDDEMEALWKTYYASIFNPARVKLKAMRAEMPKKHWKTMPETELIEGLIRQAPRRVDEMVEKSSQQLGAESFIPSGLSATDSVCSLQTLKRAAEGCRGCDLYQNANHIVFGEGQAKASLMLIGEQPGDSEDVAGRPFIGPAGQLLDEVLLEVGIDREQLYITNAVKHFKWKASGKRRLHVKPSSREISACRPWLVREVELVKPKMVVCLGATAASVVLGPSFRITKQRGEVIKTDFARWTMATYHPSALLRVPDADSRLTMRRLFTDDLRAAADYLKILSSTTSTIQQSKASE